MDVLLNKNEQRLGCLNIPVGIACAIECYDGTKWKMYARLGMPVSNRIKSTECGLINAEIAAFCMI